jgi:NADPH:quinone reductase-like Zn-dependent oxidoreductase
MSRSAEGISEHSVKAIVFDRFGEPREVLQVRDVPVPEPGPGQVRVRMIASPINPSDLMVVRGQYGRLPMLPATPGFEGAGIVDKAGPGLLRLLRGLRPGRRVAVLNGKGGTWQERVVISARQLVPIPDDVPDEQAAAFFVNPATALLITRRVLKVPSGNWLLQTAAGSTLGKMVIRLGRHYGFRTINVVRRREQAEELRLAGADAVICTADEVLEERVSALTGGQGVPFAIDAVGGDTALSVVRALGAHGRMLVYGTLSRDPLPLDPRLLMGGQKRIEGFWLSEWAQEQGPLTMLKLFRQIIRLMRAAILTSDIGASYPLDDVRTAVEMAETPGRKGKVLLRMSALAKH